MQRRQPLNYENQEVSRQFTESMQFHCTPGLKELFSDVAEKRGKTTGSLLRFLMDQFIKADRRGWKPRWNKSMFSAAERDD
jgi:hypothetical protein